MSHHFDSPSAMEDPRLDLTDFFVFAGAQPDRTVFVVNSHPDAGAKAPASFRPEALFEVKVARDGNAVEDLALRVSFGEPESDGDQPLAVTVAREGSEGDELGQGRTDEPFELRGGGRAWAGLAADPFVANGLGHGAYLAALAEGRFEPSLLVDPDVHGEHPANFFESRNVMSIVLELPDTLLGPGRIAAWTTVSLHGHAPQVQVSRMALPLTIYYFHQGSPEGTERFLRAAPGDDVANYAESVAAIAAHFARVAGRTADPVAYGRRIAQLLLPDVLEYEIGTPASFGFAERNGRGLSDDVLDVMLSLLANAPVGDGGSPAVTPREDFPYVPMAYAERPARDLADVITEARASS